MDVFETMFTFIYLFIYLFVLYFMLTFTIKSIKHIDLYNSLYTNINADGIESTDMYTNLRQPK